MANIDQVQLPDGSQYHIIDDTSGYATTTYVQNQISTINKNTIGLGNVDNTADINKPVSSPQQAALNGKVDDDIVAYVEGDTTATKRHEVGDQFILNGVLYTATAIIAVNDTIVIGTNASLADSITTQIGNANSAISTLNTAVGTKANKADLTNLDLTGTTNTTGSTISRGTFFYLNGTLVRARREIASGAIFTENTNYEVVTAGGLNGLNAEINRGSVSVNGNNANTISAILDALYEKADVDKITNKSVLEYRDGNDYNYYYLSASDNPFVFVQSYVYSGHVIMDALRLSSSNSSKIISDNGTVTDRSTFVPSGNVTIVLKY